MFIDIDDFKEYLSRGVSCVCYGIVGYHSKGNMGLLITSPEITEGVILSSSLSSEVLLVNPDLFFDRFNSVLHYSSKNHSPTPSPTDLIVEFEMVVKTQTQFDRVWKMVNLCR